MFRGTDERNDVAVFALVVSPFILWNVAHCILDVLEQALILSLSTMYSKQIPCSLLQ